MSLEPNDVQAARLRELEADSRRVYAYDFQGRAIVSSFRRYLQTDDPEKISRPLYEFLTSVCGLIARFNLDGFRASYPHAYLLLAELTDPQEGVMRTPFGGRRHAERVYRDGMTDLEVSRELAALIERHRDDAARVYAEAVAEGAAATAIECAQLLDWVLVPRGFRLVSAESSAAPCPAEAPAPALQELAAHRGWRLVPETETS